MKKLFLDNLLRFTSYVLTFPIRIILSYTIPCYYNVHLKMFLHTFVSRSHSELRSLGIYSKGTNISCVRTIVLREMSEPRIYFYFLGVFTLLAFVVVRCQDQAGMDFPTDLKG